MNSADDLGGCAQDGTVQPPPLLEEGALLLQEKKQWWPFGSPQDGGGKFKLNLHHGLHFVSTRNFKPDGDPRWSEAPALDL